MPKSPKCPEGQDGAGCHFQYLENLASAYWNSEILFAALELKIFDHIDAAGSTIDAVAHAAGCRPHALGRLLCVLQDMALVEQVDMRWFNTLLAQTYLLSDAPCYFGDFLLYRRYLQPNWRVLTERLAVDRRAIGDRLTSNDDYGLRNLHYVRAMDSLARRKGIEIAAILEAIPWSAPLLDIGGGGGAIGRQLIQSRDHGVAVLLDLPEVLQAARRIYPDAKAWLRVCPVGGDFRREPLFSTHMENGRKFGMVIMSNFLHTYNAEAAGALVLKARGMLRPNGVMIIHDYFPDRCSGTPQRGSLHDLNMFLNTFEGQCHRCDLVLKWLAASEMGGCRVMDLPSDSSVILARAPAD